MFNTPRYSQVDWNGAGLLCRFFTSNGATNRTARQAATAIWPSEANILGTFHSAGGRQAADLDSFMLVRFTVIAYGINLRCPSFNTFTLGAFSDALYAQFTVYKNQITGSGTPVPLPSPTTTPQPQPSAIPAGVITYATGRPADTCHRNPTGAGAFTGIKGVRNAIIRVGQLLTWAEISRLSDVNYCTDGEFGSFGAGVAVGKKFCREVGDGLSYDTQQLGGRGADVAQPITVSGGVKGTKRGTCKLNVRSQRAGLSIEQSVLVLRVR